MFRTKRNDWVEKCGQILFLEIPFFKVSAPERPDAIDGALRRAERFDREIKMGIPDELARERILRVMTRKMKLAEDFGFKLLAKKSHG